MSAEVNYQSEYYAADYPNKHPYFRYIVSKYEPLLESHERYRDMLYERLKYLYSIDASWEEQEHVKNQIDNAIAYSYEINEEFIWSDDEQDYDLSKNDSPNYVFKSRVQFYSIDLEELAREAFKPERIMYQLSLC